MMRRSGILLAAGALVLLTGGTGRADEVEFNGNVLKGTVTAVTSGNIEFTPDFGSEDGKGKLTIPYSVITRLTTDKDFVVLHGEEDKTVGRLLGVRGGALLVGTDAASATTVEAKTIAFSQPAAKYDGSTLAAMRSGLRYWRANFDLGAAATQATTDTTAVALGLGLDRQKDPTRLRFESAYRYGTQKPKGEDRSNTDDRLYSLLRGDYLLTERLYTFAAADALYDGIQALSVRTVPKLGLGYFLYKTKTTQFSLESGGAYTYERYFGGDTNDYPSIAFGSELHTPLLWGSLFDWRADYLPSLKDWSTDYLLRTTAALVFPMTDYFAFKATLLDEYNARPASDTDRNRLTTTLGGSFIY